MPRSLPSDRAIITSSHRRRRRWWRSCALTALGLLALTSAAAPAGAQETPPPGEEVVHSWSIAPTGSDPSEPGARPNLSYTLEPGTTIQDSVTLWNYSNVQLTFEIYATDAFNTRDGAYSLLPSERTARDAGTWVTLPQEFVTVPALTSVELPISIAIPDDASPGDHAAGIIAASKTPARAEGGEQVLLDRRAATRVYIRVPGPLNPELVIEEVSTSYSPSLNPLDGELAVTYTIRNAGNVRLGARQRVEVHDVFGTVDERTPQDVPELLPDNTVTFTKRFTGVPATVRVSADVTATPLTPPGLEADGTGDASEAAAQTTRTGHAWAIPWTLLVVLAVVLAAVVLLRRRRRGRSASEGPRTPSAGGPPSGASTDGSVGTNGNGQAPKVPARSG